MALSQSQQDLVSSNMGIVYAVMQRLNIRGCGFAETKGEAMVALCVAAESYNPAIGAFSTWAWVKISWHLKTWMTRVNRERAIAMSLPELEEERECHLPGPDAPAEASELLGAIEESLKPCASLTRDVGLLALAGLTKAEIAAELGVSVSTVARHRKQARELLSPLKQIIAEVEKLWHNP